MAAFLSDVFVAMRTKLFADIPDLKTVRLYNNQFERMNEESAFDFPCVFIQYSTLASNDLGQGVRCIDFVITLHLGFERLDLSQGGVKYNGVVVPEEIGFFEFQNDVYKSMNHFRPAGCSAMQVSEQRTDDDHNNVYVHQIDFICSGIDQATDVTNDLVETGAPIELELGVDLIIDNPEIRTGKEIV